MRDFFDLIFEFIEFVREVIVPLIFLLTLALLLALPTAYLIGKYITTPNFGKAVGRPVKYNFWGGGCFVNVGDNNWVECENYNAFVESERRNRK